MYNFLNNFERDEITDYELIQLYHPELLIKEKTFFSKYKIVIYILIFLLIVSILFIILL